MSRAEPDPTVLARQVAVAGGRRQAARTLLLDLDGTLAPFAATPEEVQVMPRSLMALAMLVSADWKIAVISGRPWWQTRVMVPVPGVWVFGSHGAEDENGSLVPGIPTNLYQRVGFLEKKAWDLVREFPGVWIERKPVGLALHERPVPPEYRLAWARRRDSWLKEQELGGLMCVPGNGVVELRPEGIHKGQVARRFIPGNGPEAPDDSLVAFGDDITDEDTFRVVKGRGLTIRVGLAPRDSAAELQLASPHEVQDFLGELALLAVNQPPIDPEIAP